MAAAIRATTGRSSMSARPESRTASRPSRTAGGTRTASPPISLVVIARHTRERPVPPVAGRRTGIGSGTRDRRTCPHRSKAQWPPFAPWLSSDAALSPPTESSRGRRRVRELSGRSPAPPHPRARLPGPPKFWPLRAPSARGPLGMLSGLSRAEAGVWLPIRTSSSNTLSSRERRRSRT
jgi:hypothetical protein